MKWLKKFEELSPELIRRAGNQLISKGHSERGLDLLDKSYSGSEPFNVWITENGSWIKRLPKGDSDRSEPLPLSYNFSSSKFYFYTRNSTFELGGKGMDAEKLIQFWEQGQCDLGFSIDFYFKPTKETIKSVKFDKEYFDKEVPLFNINFLIHKKINDRDNSVLVTKLSKDSVYMQKYFSEICRVEPKITLSYPNAKNLPAKTYSDNNEYGLFSDRKSALKFKNNILPKEMDEHTDKIMDILSILNMKSDKVEGILNFYKRVTLNYLYRSEIPHYVNSAADTEKYFFGYEKDIRS
jgi:DNA-directed RNA polymerase subunit F